MAAIEERCGSSRILFRYHVRKRKVGVSDRRVQALIPLPPIRASGRESQRTLNFRIRLVTWQSEQKSSKARREALVQVCSIC